MLVTIADRSCSERDYETIEDIRDQRERFRVFGDVVRTDCMLVGVADAAGGRDDGDDGRKRAD